MTANQSCVVATRTAMMASFEDVDNDTDEDSRSSSPSLHCSERDDECDESIDALIERYAGSRQQQQQQQLDDDCSDDEKSGGLDDDEDAVSKPVVRMKLPLFEAPEFIQRLRGYNEATAGNSVSFVAQYKAFPVPTVKWFKDEEEVRATDRHLLESSESSHEGIIRLIINNVRPSDEGAYKCKVENREGVASTTGYLSVQGGESRSRKSGRATSSRCSNRLGPSTSSPCRSPGVSTPPILRPIVEQKSMEENEERELARQPPSPLQAFIDGIRHSAKSRHPPICYGAENVFGTVDDDSGDSDGEIDEVFDSEEDAASVIMSSDSLEQLPIVTPTSTDDDPVEDFNEPTRVEGCRPASSKSAAETDSRTWNAVDDDHSHHRHHRQQQQQARQQVVVSTGLAPARSADVPDDDRTTSSPSPSPSPSPLSSSSSSLLPAAATIEADSQSSSSSSFHKRRLGRLQIQHRLAIDLPDEPPSALPAETSPAVSLDETGSRDDHVAHPDVSDASDFVAADARLANLTSPAAATATAAASIRPSIRSARGVSFDLVPEMFRLAQDAVMTAIDNPLVQFYVAFVAGVAAFANFFGVQPSWLVLMVALASFVSFHLLRPRRMNSSLSPASLG